jgi:hypothetical protein
MSQQKFENIRPYNDDEVPAAVARVVESPYFDEIVKYVFPDVPPQKCKEMFSTIKTVRDFQENIMHKAINGIISKTSEKLTFSGFDKLNNDHRYMFLSNHRDILLDAAILQVLLFDNEIETSEITFGSNLMKGQTVIDIGKLNKMFRIERGGNIKDFYRNSVEVSSYMRYAITEKHQSTWIAQRNGRTKDGDDKTELGVLKMFSLSSDKPFADNLNELNITPIAVSYEYEPCVFLKTQELFVSKYQKYVKSEREDLNSILHGIMQPKGQIHLAVTNTITEDELKECDTYLKNEKFHHLGQIIDKRIYDNYTLWKTNYIAYDMLTAGEKFKNYYSPDEKTAFVAYMENGLKRLIGDYDELCEIFLGIYANPVKNVKEKK